MGTCGREWKETTEGRQGTAYDLAVALLQVSSWPPTTISPPSTESIHTSLDTASTPWERLSHGFQLTTSFTGYSPLPFNITTGANTIQGTGGRPTVNGVFISRNAGVGHAILNLNVRLSRTFALSERLRLQVLAEMFNTLNHVNVVTLNGVFGTGVYPTVPSPTFRQITAVNDPRTAQFGLRLSF